MNGIDMQNLEDIHFIHAQRRRNLHGLIITRGAEQAFRCNIFENIRLVFLSVNLS